LRRSIAIIMPGRLLSHPAMRPAHRSNGAHRELDESAMTSRLTSEDFMPHDHGDAVGHGDGAELARRAAGFLDAALADCAWRISAMLQGAASFQQDASDKGAMDLLIRQPHRVIIGAVRRSLGPFRDVAGRKLGFVEFRHGRTLSCVSYLGGQL